MNNKNKLLSLTLVYVHLLAESHSEGYLPAFTFSLCESDAPASRRMHIVLFVMGQCKKHEDKVLRMKSL